MKTVAVLCVSILLASGSAVSADPHCGAAPRCVAHVDYDSRITEFHKRILESMHLPYSLENQEGRVAVWWAPQSEAEENEVNGRVSQFAFAIHACGREVWPAPETPAGTLTSCIKAKS